MKNQTAAPKTNQQPVHHIRNSGITASIWQQDTQNGSMFNVTFQRAYRDGDEWKNSSSFGKKDLLVLSFIAARAYEWIGNQPRNPKATEE